MPTRLKSRNRFIHAVKPLNGKPKIKTSQAAIWPLRSLCQKETLCRNGDTTKMIIRPWRRPSNNGTPRRMPSPTTALQTRQTQCFQLLYQSLCFITAEGMYRHERRGRIIATTRCQCNPFRSFDYVHFYGWLTSRLPDNTRNHIQLYYTKHRKQSVKLSENMNYLKGGVFQ